MNTGCLVYFTALCACQSLPGPGTRQAPSSDAERYSASAIATLNQQATPSPRIESALGAGVASASFDDQHPVRVNLSPYCEPEQQLSEHWGQNHWLTGPEPELVALTTRLNGTAGYLGVVTEGRRRLFVVVFEPNTANRAELQNLIGRGPFVYGIELRSACYSQAERTQAEASLRDLKQDPQIQQAIWLQQFDASNGGLRVWVLPGHEKEAARIQASLGDRVNLWMSRAFGSH